MTTLLLVSYFIAILAFATWAVARDIRKRQAERPDLSEGEFWREEAVSYRRGAIKLVILAAASALIRSEGPSALNWVRDRPLEETQQKKVVGAPVLVPIALTHSQPPKGNRTGEREQ